MKYEHDSSATPARLPYLSTRHLLAHDGDCAAGHSKGHSDILITGTTEEEHLKTSAIMLSQLEKAGLHVKKSKCQFMASYVTQD